MKYKLIFIHDSAVVNCNYMKLLLKFIGAIRSRMKQPKKEVSSSHISESN